MRRTCFATCRSRTPANPPTNHRPHRPGPPGVPSPWPPASRAAAWALPYAAGRSVALATGSGSGPAGTATVAGGGRGTRRLLGGRADRRAQASAGWSNRCCWSPGSTQPAWVCAGNRPRQRRAGRRPAALLAVLPRPGRPGRRAGAGLSRALALGALGLLRAIPPAQHEGYLAALTGAAALAAAPVLAPPAAPAPRPPPRPLPDGRPPGPGSRLAAGLALLLPWIWVGALGGLLETALALAASAASAGSSPACSIGLLDRLRHHTDGRPAGPARLVLLGGLVAGVALALVAGGTGRPVAHSPRCWSCRRPGSPSPPSVDSPAGRGPTRRPDRRIRVRRLAGRARRTRPTGLRGPGGDLRSCWRAAGTYRSGRRSRAVHPSPWRCCSVSATACVRSYPGPIPTPPAGDDRRGGAAAGQRCGSTSAGSARPTRRAPLRGAEGAGALTCSGPTGSAGPTGPGQARSTSGWSTPPSGRRRPLRATLDRRRLDYTPYYLVNAIEVDGGPAVRAWLAGRDDVDRVLLEPAAAPAAEPPGTGHGAAPRAPDRTRPWNMTLLGADRGLVGAGSHRLGHRGRQLGLRRGRHAIRPCAAGFRAATTPGTTRGTAPAPPPTTAARHAHARAPRSARRASGWPPAPTGSAASTSTATSAARRTTWTASSSCWRRSRTAETRSPTAGPERAPQVLTNSWACPPARGLRPPRPAPGHRRASPRPASSSSRPPATPARAAARSPTRPPLRRTCFTVGAVDRARQVAEFSSRGPTAAGAAKPDLVAPGRGRPVRDARWRVRRARGTSMATPHVAGVVALMWSANPALIGDLDRTWRILRDTATPVPSPDGDPTVPSATCGPQQPHRRRPRQRLRRRPHRPGVRKGPLLSLFV